MSINDRPVLVLGATGKTGRRIVTKLEERGVPVRSGSRNADPAFEWSDPSTWDRALAGVRAAYICFFPDLAVPEAPGAIAEFTRRAQAAGVERLVLLSGRGEANAQRCEEIVHAADLETTVVRASWFAQNFDEGHLIDAVRAGVLALPAGQVREPFVDIEDLCDVAVAALCDEGHAGRSYELTGPRLLSFDEVARQLSAAAGHEVRYQPVSFEEHQELLGKEVGPEFAAFLTDLMRETLDGRNESVADGVQQALGREPRDFADYARTVGASGIWSRGA